MKPIPANFDITQPMELFGKKPADILARFTLDQLCRLAGIRNNATRQCLPIALVLGPEHWKSTDTHYVGIGKDRKITKTYALRVLEVLAHGFHDPAARECVCRQGLFRAPKRVPKRKK